MTARPNSEAVTQPHRVLTPGDVGTAEADALVARFEAAPNSVPSHLVMPLCRYVSARDRERAAAETTDKLRTSLLRAAREGR